MWIYSPIILWKFGCPKFSLCIYYKYQNVSLLQQFSYLEGRSGENVSVSVEPTRRKKSLVFRLGQQWQLQLLALSGLAFLIIFCYIPIAWNVIAFQDFKILKGIGGSAWVGFKHFKAFLSDTTFWMSLKNTLGMSATKFGVNTVGPILFAVLLSEMPNERLKKTVQTFTYLPHFLSYVVVATLVNTILGNGGMLNHVFAAMGLPAQHLLEQSSTFWWLGTWLDFWKETGWNSILYLAAISGVNPELYEAATVDGAGRIRRIWHVTLPAIRWTFLMLLIMNLGNLLSGGPVGSNFSQSRLIGNAFTYSKSYVLDLYSLEVGMNNMRYSFATAISLCNSVVSMILLLSANYITERLTSESLF